MCGYCQGKDDKHSSRCLSSSVDDPSNMTQTECIVRNLDNALFFAAARVDCSLKTKNGFSLDKVCLDSNLRKLLPQTIISGEEGESQKPKIKHIPTAREKEIIFDMSHNVKDFDELLQKLKIYNFDVNKETDENGNYLVHVAVNAGVSHLPLLMLLTQKCGADIEKRERTGRTCLMIAAERGDPVVVDTLICSLQACPNTRHNSTGWVALHYACMVDNKDVVSILLKGGGDFTLEDKHGARPDDVAARYGATDCRDMIVSARAQRMKTLTKLVSQGMLTLSDLELSDQYVTDADGYTLLMTAALTNNLSSLQILLQQNGVPLDAQHEKTLMTALAMAAGRGHVEVVQCLLSHGARAEVRDMCGYLALHHAVNHGHETVVKLLLSNDKALTSLMKAWNLAKEPDIKTAIEEAQHRRQKEVVNPVLFECAVSGDAQKLYCVLEFGDSVNITDSYGNWPLCLAVENGHLDIVTLLYQWDADIYRRHVITGNTALHFACSKGCFDIAKLLLDRYRQDKEIKEHSINKRDLSISPGIINAINEDNKTPLTLAIEKGHYNLVEILLSYGASTAVLDVRGQLHNCLNYPGIGLLLDAARKKHTQAITDAITQRRGLKKLKAIFLPRFDHNLRHLVTKDTPLMQACQLGRVDIVRFLLQSAVYDTKDCVCEDWITATHSSPSRSVNNFTTTSEMTSQSSDGICQCQIRRSKLSSSRLSRFARKATLNRSFKHATPGGNGIRTPYKTAPDLLHFTKDPINDNVIETNQEVNRNTKSKPEDLGKYDGLLEETIKFVTPWDVEEEERNQDQLTEEEMYEEYIPETIGSLLDSYSPAYPGSIFVSENKISHVCAVNPLDGATAFHRALQGGDNIEVLNLLLDADPSAVNIQDCTGLSPLHQACKLGRKKIVKKLIELSFVDINCRTLDGELPEEMTTSETLIKMITQARKQHVPRSRSSPLLALTNSIFGMSSTDDSESQDDFNDLNPRFLMMRCHVGTGDML